MEFKKMSLNRLPLFLFLLSLSIVALLLTTQAAETGKVDINTANKWALAQVLHGVGEKKAAAIVAFREKHGAFKSADDLAQVYGISQKLVDGNRDNIVVSDVEIIPKRKIPHFVNINTADVMTLSRELHGVGYKKAVAIVAFREQQGKFKSIFDLFQVTGIGKKTIERNKDKIVLQDPEAETATEPPSTAESETATEPPSTAESETATE
jgi:competence protein ComEA